MKIFHAHIHKSIALSLIAGTTISACATNDSPLRQTNSPLPIEARDSGGGQVTSFRAYESSGRLYVVGSAKKHASVSSGHVDVQLIDAGGHVIAEKQDRIDPPHPRPGGGKRDNSTYVASFPVSEARDAAKIRVTFHSESHS